MADRATSAAPSRSDLLRRGTELLTAEDRAPALFLSGPTGIGKSWLAEQIVTALLDDAVVGRDVAVVRAIATPSAASIPFGAFAHLLADEPAEPTRLLEPPDLLEPPGLLDALRSVRRRLLDRRGGRTLVIVVDDAHGLDDPSATVVRQLTATNDATALVTVRAGEPLPAPVRALRADPGVVEIEIAPMTVEEVNRLAHAALGRWLERPSLQHLHHLSGGNPLFARELLADAAAEDRLSVRRGLVRLTGGSASTRLVALVSRDLDRVSAAAADLVDAIAVGEPLPVGVARRLADLATLADLEGRGIISVNRFGDQQVRLSHPLFGEVRRARLGPLRRAHLAERLARAFDATGVEHADDALRVVNWRLEAGEVVEWKAEKGQDVLDELFQIAGARRLGELSLVDVRSPINQRGLIFHDTLFDENAVCHIAFGRGYPEGIQNGSKLSAEELDALGLNSSDTHEDLMIGTTTMKVIGTCADGSEVLIMDNGMFVDEVMA